MIDNGPVDSDTHREHCKLTVSPDGKAWNAPVPAGTMLLLRNPIDAELLKLVNE